MITIGNIKLADSEVQLRAIRAGGPGGQHVNKVASSIHLQFDIKASSLPDPIKQRLLSHNRHQGQTGLIIIKAQRFRSLERNKEDALQRLNSLITAATVRPKNRKKTKPSRRAKQKRVDSKTRRGQVKSLRGRVR